MKNLGVLRPNISGLAYVVEEPHSYEKQKQREPAKKMALLVYFNLFAVDEMGCAVWAKNFFA